MNAVNIESLKKSYDAKVNALSNVSLSIPKGEIFGFLGPNGACVYGQQFKTSVNQ